MKKPIISQEYRQTKYVEINLAILNVKRSIDRSSIGQFNLYLLNKLSSIV